MKKRDLYVFAALLALTAPLAACDNDQPQTPQLEEVSSVNPAELNGSDTAAGEIAPDVTRPVPDAGDAPTGGEVVLPQDIHEENIPPPPSREDFTDESCDYEGWIGKPVDETAIKAEGRPSRIIKPGDPVTMDHNPGRINVEHEDGNVTRVWCG